MTDTHPPDLREMLEAFHDKFEEEVFSRDRINQEFRFDLMKEEFREYRDEVRKDGFDAEAVEEELADIVYLAFGTAVCHDLDLYSVLEETHEENMGKDALKTPAYYSDKGGGRECWRCGFTDFNDVIGNDTREGYCPQCGARLAEREEPQ